MLRLPSQVCFHEGHTPLHQPFLNAQAATSEGSLTQGRSAGLQGPLEMFQAVDNTVLEQVT